MKQLLSKIPFVVIGILIAIIFFKGCETTKDCETVYINRTDTVRTVDTVWATKQGKATTFKPKVKDSIKVVVDSSACSYTRIYTDSVGDSLVTITYQDSIQGRLLKKDISWKLRIPTIKETITITKETTILQTKPPKFTMFVGMNIGGNKERFGVGPYISLNTPSKQFTYNYEMIRQTHNIGLGIRLFKTKK